MGEFQDYILDQDKDLITKMDVIRRLQKLLKDKRGETLFFDKSVLFKTEIARMFIDYMYINVDRDLVLTASLLCNCKKVDNAQKIGKLQTYAKEGADYLLEIGFNQRFCRICEGVNRYSIQEKRETESDILELVDQFGGMLLDRPERQGFNPEEALVQLERDNLKDVYNRYLGQFHEFVDLMESQNIGMSICGKEIGITKKPFAILKKNIHDDAKDLEDMINRINSFEKGMSKALEETAQNMFNSVPNGNVKPLFSADTVRNVKEALKKGNENQNLNYGQNNNQANF